MVPVSLLITVIDSIHKQIELVQSNKEQCQLLGQRLKHLQQILPKTEEEKNNVKGQRFDDAVNTCYETVQSCLMHINFYVGQKWYQRAIRGGSDHKAFTQLHTQIDQSQLLLTTALAINQEVMQQKNHEWQQQVAIAQQKDQNELKLKLQQIEQLMQQQIAHNLAQLSKAEQEVLKKSQSEAVKNQMQHHLQATIDPADTVDEKLRLDMADLEFQGLLAKGNFGSVYEGKWQNQAAAIKTINHLTEQTRNEFIREVKIIGRLKHPHITPLFGVCLDRGFECLIMKRMEQGTLSQYLLQKPFLNFSEQHHLILGLLEAVVYLHEQGIVHRDLKAANILVHQDQLFISDFGLAKLKNSISIQTLKALPNLDISCAPEFLEGKEITEKADIYSIGWLMWHILSGKPWPNLNQKQASADFASLNGISTEYRILIEQCWNTHPLRRPSATILLEKAKAIQPAPAAKLDTIYDEGQKFESSSRYEDAMLVYQQAAKQGHSKSAYCLGMLYANKKIKFNQHAMLHYLSQSANANYYRAQYNLARIYEKGELAPENKKLAVILYQSVIDNSQTPDDIKVAATRKVSSLSDPSLATESKEKNYTMIK